MLKNKSWRTTLLGIVVMLFGFYSGWVVWIPIQTVYFNVVYVEPSHICLIFAGWIGLHARDHKCL